MKNGMWTGIEESITNIDLRHYIMQSNLTTPTIKQNFKQFLQPRTTKYLDI